MSEVRNNEMQILIDIINDFSTDKFVRFFRDKNHSFAPRKEDLLQYDDVNFKDGIKLGEIQFTQDEKMLICAFKASQPLSERSSKKAQYEKGKKILKDNNADAGIFIFHDANNNFRFSLIYAEYLGVRRKFSYFKRLTFFVSPRLTNKTFLQQIGECDFSNFESIKKAFSVEPVTKQFYGELQYWYFWAMDKIKFPDDYKYSNDPAKDKEIRNATNLIRLITRIIFIRFLSEKGLIPSELFSGEKLGKVVKDFMRDNKASNFYNAILQNLFFGTLNQKMDERKFAQESGFQTNKKEYGVKNLYRYADKFLFSKDEVLKLFKDIPFLNGGLFDCLDKEDESGKVINIDGFSRNSAKQSIIPDYLFFQQEEERTDLSNYGLGKGRPVRGLIEILNSYNFTIDENTPVDQEIALDPELLGKVFENLLASYNPETATTARKATGSYYTPREIVDYMVQESLVVYLANAINNAPQPPLKLRGGEGGVILPSPLAGEASHNIPSPLVGEGKGEGDNDSRLRQLLSYSEEIPEFSAPERKKIISAIDNIKILDPACGSGAFPMGILHKLVYALQKLDPENKYWHELQYQKALKESEEVFKQDDKNQRQERLEEINEAFDEGINYPDYARKLYLIENCIYGVDIQPIAIQISKLRFFISLVLDQKVDRGKENLGIRALPNLETKFVAANTLIGLDIPKEDLLTGIGEIKPIQDELARERHKYFSAKTRSEKREYQKQDKKLREKLVEIIKKLLVDKKQDDIIQIKKLIDEKKIELQQTTQEPDHIEVIERYNLFGEKEQITLDKKKEHINRIKLTIKEKEKQLESLQNQVEGDSVIKIAKKIANFDLYDQNASADWFDPEWMFGITSYSPLTKGDAGGCGGFDVVIANPPYGLLNKRQNQVEAITVTSQQLDYFKKLPDYKPAMGGMINIFKLFILKSVYLLKESGIFSEIFPLAFIADSSAANLRSYIFNNCSIQFIEAFPERDNPKKRVFEAAKMSVCVMNLIKNSKKNSFFIRINDDRYIDEQKPKTFLNADLIALLDKANLTIPLMTQEDIDIIAAIYRKSIRFGDIGHCYTGEIDITLGKPYISHNSQDAPLLRGAIIDRYIVRETMSQGEFLYLKKQKYLKENSGGKAIHYQSARIVMQGITGVNEKIRLKMTLIDKGVFCANSINYIVFNDNNVNTKVALGILNSRLMNYIFSKFSTNSNVNGYEVDNLPYPKIPESAQQPFITLVDQILAAKKKDPKTDTSALEREIDEMVYALYGLTPEEIEIVEGKARKTEGVRS